MKRMEHVLVNVEKRLWEDVGHGGMGRNINHRLTSQISQSVYNVVKDTVWDTNILRQEFREMWDHLDHKQSDTGARIWNLN